MKKFLFFIAILLITSGCVISSPISMEYNDGIYHFILTGDKIKKKIKFLSSPNLITNTEAHNKSGSIFTINTGFFDPKNQKTISYIITDSETAEDPLFNENMMTNPVYEIAQHNANIDFMCSIVNSAQGGPQLLPDLRLEEEFFIVKDKDGNIIRESASVLHKTPRTLIGIKNLEKGEQEAHIFIVTNKHPMDIYEARDLCKQYELDSAMAFDGGSSTSLNYKDIKVTSTQDSGDTGRALKSFMIIRK